MNDEQPLTFYRHSESSPCSYLPGEDSNSIFLDPRLEPDSDLCNRLHINGFRRSGKLIYRPQCPTCSACQSARIINNEFKASKSQRRTWKRNQDISFRWTDPVFNQEHYQLYQNYINERHKDGDMHPPSEDQYTDFLIEGFGSHKILEARTEHGELIGACVVDQFYDGLSAIYSYFKPDLARRSLGQLFILALIEFGRQAGLTHTYLGYYVKGSAKMDYKAKYKPLQIFDGNQWRALIQQDLEP